MPDKDIEWYWNSHNFPSLHFEISYRTYIRSQLLPYLSTESLLITNRLITMHICARRGDICHRIGYYRTLTIPCIVECTSFDNRSWGTAEQGAGARVLQSGSSKAVDQGNLEASRRLSTVFGVIYVVTYLDQYPTYMFEHRYMLQQGGAYTSPRSVSLSPFPLATYLSFSLTFHAVHEYVHCRTRTYYVSN